ncbi:MAG: FGGY-family carbohydrate kinase [Candidatus Anaerobiospirillum merdipullorum]|uniref:FGGY-family carbohydrate kinase n=1 Tax=Candidatus Anaerobiospirillum merdipullorum TaxID=2838450 RepID=A0A9E2KMH1_9GAMM|nr:FGGY-family carbohydrate kinase [Candidatus Anaerobiospirillum merdipullorum]
MTLDLSKCSLGIELGSTRIKAVLIDDKHMPIAQGSHEWENQLVDGIWTYSLEDVWAGVQDCYRDLVADVQAKFNTQITTLGAIGFSAMMHGYLAFDKDDKLLVPFRTWRNTITRKASEELTEKFNFNIPERWSIAHFYQCMLAKEPHVGQVAFFTTLAGYIHYKLTGCKVLGVGDAAGMFPIDSTTGDYDSKMLEQFNAIAKEHGYEVSVKDLMPKVLCAGEDAGKLTAEGAKLLDPTGTLQAGIPLCPPEGDAGTGMVATNSVAVRTGNVSAGTSIFAMIVLERSLAKLHRELDMVTTPDGLPVAMVHANNCTSDLNAWVGLFAEFADKIGAKISTNDLYGVLYRNALTGANDCGGLMSYGYYSGEFITGLEEGRPLFMRKPDADFTLANFMRTHLYSALGALKIGMDILINEEKVGLDKLLGHGGLFKTKGVGQKIMADAMNAPVSVMETAGEGGAWGIALLAAYEINKQPGQSLPDYLNNEVFKDSKGSTIDPTPEDVAGFERFMEGYKAGLAAEKAAAAEYK